jgi:hypothetical protein
MPGSPSHHVEGLPDVEGWDFIMKQVTHAIDEDPAGLFPPQWVFEHVWLQGDLKSVPVVLLSHRLEPACKTFGIAELTAGTYF